MAEDQLRSELQALLGQATRHGIHTARATRRGLKLTLDGRDIVLALESIEQIIAELGVQEVSQYVAKLSRERVAKLDLDPATLLKLRVSLLLGLGQARWLTPDERRSALARTYRRYVREGRPAREGADAFRERYIELRRVEREHLLAEACDLILRSVLAAEVRDVVHLQTDSGSDSSGNGYRIIDYDDQHVYPAAADERRYVARKRTILALRDGVRQFRQQYTVTTTRGATPDPRIIGVGRMSVERIRPHEENSETGYRYDLVIDFPPLRKSETRALQWIVDIDQGPGTIAGSGIQVAGVSPSMTIDHATISVGFQPPLSPSRIWRFDGVAPGDVRLPEAASAEVRIVDGHAAAEWHNVKAGRASGIAWEW